MTAADLEGAASKRALKEVLVETLQEQRELFHEVFAEVLEDFALAEAVREGQQTRTATREEAFSALRGKTRKRAAAPLSGNIDDRRRSVR
jgi:hypothetical protein